jgi:hypothetical protein
MLGFGDGVGFVTPAQPAARCADALGMTSRHAATGLLLAAAVVGALAGCGAGAATVSGSAAAPATRTAGTAPAAPPGQATLAPAGQPSAKATLRPAGQPTAKATAKAAPLSVAAAGQVYLRAVGPANRAKFAMYDVIGGADVATLDLGAAGIAVTRYIAAVRIEVTALQRVTWPATVAADVASLIREKQAQVRGYQLALQAPTADNFARLFNALQAYSDTADRIRAALRLPPTQSR